MGNKPACLLVTGMSLRKLYNSLTLIISHEAVLSDCKIFILQSRLMLCLLCNNNFISEFQ